MVGDSHTPALGPRCGRQRPGWLRNAGQSGKSKPMLHIANVKYIITKKMKCSVQTQTSSQIYFNTGLLLSDHAKDEQ